MPIVSVKIHPAIGIARLGNSPADFFIGPERPGEQPDPAGGFKDGQCRVKRQAARFRVFATDNNGYAGMTIQKLRRYDKGVRDIKITWTERDSYCAQATAGTTTYHQVGPAEASKPGPCPGRR